MNDVISFFMQISKLGSTFTIQAAAHHAEYCYEV